MTTSPTIQTNPLDPVFSGVPVVYPQTGMVNPTWNKWFVDLREKVNVINTTVAALSGGTLKPVIKVHAGTNVTVDNTDIQNPIVSASGGGSGASYGNRVDNPNDPYWAGGNLGYDIEWTLLADNASPVLPPDWSWGPGQGSATYTQLLGAGILTHPGATTDDVRFIYRPFPTQTTWTLTVKAIIDGLGSDYYVGGICLYNSSTGQLINFGARSGSTINIEYWVNRTTNGSAIVIASTDMQPNYFRVVFHSHTSYDFLTSLDGVAWFPVTLAYNVSGKMTPDSIGLFVHRNGPAGYETLGSFYFLRIR